MPDAEENPGNARQREIYINGAAGIEPEVPVPFEELEAAAVEALPRVREAVGPDATVLLDSGVRRGAEALKALALGADSVGVGRPYVYGLAVDGANGVEGVCRNLVADLDLTLGLTGRTRAADLDRSLLVDEREL